jgi:L-threonylcarbamoyladenylate synthase
MQTQILKIDAHHPDAEIIRQAADILRRGGLVAFPTETVYGLGTNALDEAAVRKIFAAKGRPPANPLIVHVATIDEARALVRDWPDAAQKLAERFWPGSLTLVLSRGDQIANVVTAGGPTVALRIPAHDAALALLRQVRLPIAAPSANRSNLLSPTLAEHVERDLHGQVDLILDGGPCPGGLESTVLDVSTTPARLLRPGLVTPAQLEAVIGPIARFQNTSGATDNAPLPSPGMMARHYAPRTPLECCHGSGLDRVRELTGAGLRVGWLALAAVAAEKSDMVTQIILPAEPRAYSSQLYAALHHLDNAGLDCIVVDLPPRDDAWLAVHDRLRRASATS